MREDTGMIYPFPAPTSGMNDKLPLMSLPENFALDLTNLFPTASGIRKRNGTERLTASAFTGACETVMTLAKEDGTWVTIVAGDNDLMIVNLTTHAKTSIKGTATITADRWQWVQYYDQLFVANGADRVLSWNGTGDFAVAGFECDGLNDDNLSSPAVYNENLYFCKGTSLWYTHDARATTGVLDEYDLATILTRGGYLLFGGSSTHDLGDGSQEMFVVVSSAGEALAFTGANPGDATWQLIGHYYLPRALGREAFVNMGADIQIITEQGVIAMSDVITPSEETKRTGRYQKATENIDNAFSRAAKSYRSQTGWCGVAYTFGDMLIINVPLGADASMQYVMNTLTEGAWCRFTDINARSWCLVDGEALFGGCDGHLYRFDLVQNDNIYNASLGDGIRIRGETAFTYCGDPTMIKSFLMVKTLLNANGSATLGLANNVNFQRTAEAENIQINGSGSGALWNEALWGTAEWAGQMETSFEWSDMRDSGVNCNLVFSGTLTGIDLEILAFFVQYKPGGSL